MTPAEHVPLAEVKNRLSEVVDRLEHEHGRVVITKHGRPAAVILSLDDLELEGRHSAHRGDYRVVYRVDRPRHRVYVLAIGHRADIYRRG